MVTNNVRGETVDSNDVKPGKGGEWAQADPGCAEV